MAMLDFMGGGPLRALDPGAIPAGGGLMMRTANYKHVMRILKCWIIDVRLETSWRSMWIDCQEISLAFTPPPR